MWIVPAQTLPVEYVVSEAIMSARARASGRVGMKMRCCGCQVPSPALDELITNWVIRFFINSLGSTAWAVGGSCLLVCCSFQAVLTSTKLLISFKHRVVRFTVQFLLIWEDECLLLALRVQLLAKNEWIFSIWVFYSAVKEELRVWLTDAQHAFMKTSYCW